MTGGSSVHAGWFVLLVEIFDNILLSVTVDSFVNSVVYAIVVTLRSFVESVVTKDESKMTRRIIMVHVFNNFESNLSGHSVFNAVDHLFIFFGPGQIEVIPDSV
jgi:hypothetical protein